MMAQEENRRFWIVKPDHIYFEIWHDHIADDLHIGLMNENQVHEERWKRYFATGGKIPMLDHTWFTSFDNTPQLRIPASFYPDYFESRTYRFVSPRLFDLLDQPRGTLQAVKTEITWVGPNPPDQTYLWLSYIPRCPAIDPDRSDVEHVDYYTPTDGRPPIRKIRGFGALEMRADIAPASGLFCAAEDFYTVFATDAVAEAVMRAGCSGIEFDEPETRDEMQGPLRRRGPHGVELHPYGVAARQKRGLPGPER